MKPPPQFLENFLLWIRRTFFLNIYLVFKLEKKYNIFQKQDKLRQDNKRESHEKHENRNIKITENTYKLFKIPQQK